MKAAMISHFALINARGRPLALKRTYVSRVTPRWQLSQADHRDGGQTCIIGAHSSMTLDKPSTVGATLRAHRLHKGLDLLGIAKTLQIRRGYLSLIEEGRYEHLPGPTYADGFVRAYADHLGLDRPAVLHQFKLETAGRKIGGGPQFPVPEAEPGMAKVVLLVVIVLLAIVLYGNWCVLLPGSSGLEELVSAAPKSWETLEPTVPAAPTMAEPARADEVGASLASPSAFPAPAPADAPGEVPVVDRVTAPVSPGLSSTAAAPAAAKDPAAAAARFEPPAPPRG